MARDAAEAGHGLKLKKPRRGESRQGFDNEIAEQEINVVNKNTTEPVQIIPFQFEAREVRTLLIDDQPWFCAADVCAVLEYANSRQAIQKNCRAKGVSVRDTPTNGGVQVMTFIDEGNLYRLIIKSRKEEAQRFEAWVCDEVLPSIRRHGRYVDEGGKLDSLVGAVIGTSGVLVLDRVIEQKASPIPSGMRRSFKHTMKSRLRSRFNVQRTDMIPVEQMADACNFVAAYALEGEWLSAAESRPGTVMADEDLYRVWFICNHFEHLNDVQRRTNLCQHLSGLGSRLGAEMIDHFRDGGAAVHVVLKKYEPAMREAANRLGLNRSTH